MSFVIIVFTTRVEPEWVVVARRFRMPTMSVTARLRPAKPVRRMAASILMHRVMPTSKIALARTISVRALRQPLVSLGRAS